jgi:hypothetical protein
MEPQSSSSFPPVKTSMSYRLEAASNKTFLAAKLSTTAKTTSPSLIKEDAVILGDSSSATPAKSSETTHLGTGMIEVLKLKLLIFLMADFAQLGKWLEDMFFQSLMKIKE